MSAWSRAMEAMAKMQQWLLSESSKPATILCGCGEIAIWIYPVEGGSYVYCGGCHGKAFEKEPQP